MEPDIPPKPHRHPNESLKNFVLLSVFFVVSDLLHFVLSMNRWLAMAIGVACSLPIFLLVPPRPRLGLGRMALLAVLCCLIFAVDYLVCLHFHLN